MYNKDFPFHSKMSFPGLMSKTLSVSSHNQNFHIKNSLFESDVVNPSFEKKDEWRVLPNLEEGPPEKGPHVKGRSYNH